MPNNATQFEAKSQSDKFKDAARDLGGDPDEVKWEDKLRKLFKQKLMEKTTDSKGR